MKKNQVVLLTAEFPFGKGETFLETELPYLADGFDEVVLVPLARRGGERRGIADKCLVSPLVVELSFLQKVLAFRYLFSKEVRRELRVIRRVYGKRLTKGVLATMLVSYARAMRIAKRLEAFIDKDKNQVFYSYWCEDSALALALLKKKYPRFKAVTRMHGWDVYFEVSAVGYLPFRHFIAEQLDGLLPISEKGKTYVKEGWKVGDLSKVNVSRLGVKKQVFKHGRSNDFLIVSCSNVIPLKRVGLILEALKLIQSPFNWTHFGDGSLLDEVKEVAKGTGFEFRGRVPNKEVLDFYGANSVSLFINVSTSEGVPVSIMEAFSFGIPVIATDVGGNGEIVNNKNGTLVPVDITPNELAQEIVKYIEMDENELLEKRKAAYATWEEEYNAEKNYTSFVETLKH